MVCPCSRTIGDAEELDSTLELLACIESFLRRACRLKSVPRGRVRLAVSSTGKLQAGEPSSTQASHSRIMRRVDAMSMLSFDPCFSAWRSGVVCLLLPARGIPPYMWAACSPSGSSRSSPSGRSSPRAFGSSLICIGTPHKTRKALA